MRVPRSKFRPTTVTSVPPDRGPSPGCTSVTTTASWKANFRPEFVQSLPPFVDTSNDTTPLVGPTPGRASTTDTDALDKPCSCTVSNGMSPSSDPDVWVALKDRNVIAHACTFALPFMVLWEYCANRSECASDTISDTEKCHAATRSALLTPVEFDGTGTLVTATSPMTVNPSSAARTSAAVALGYSGTVVFTSVVVSASHAGLVPVSPHRTTVGSTNDSVYAPVALAGEAPVGAVTTNSCTSGSACSRGVTHWMLDGEWYRAGTAMVPNRHMSDDVAVRL